MVTLGTDYTVDNPLNPLPKSVDSAPQFTQSNPMPNSQLSSIFAHIDHNRQSFIDRLIDYVRQPSISAHGIGIAEVAAFLNDYLTQMGFATESLPTAGWPMIYGRRDDVPGAPTRCV